MQICFKLFNILMIELQKKVVLNLLYLTYLKEPKHEVLHDGIKCEYKLCKNGAFIDIQYPRL